MATVQQQEQIIPQSSRHLQAVWEVRRHMLHLDRVSHMTAHIDNQPPASWTARHGKINAKREADKRERSKEIDRGNKLLLDRLGDINKRAAWDPRTSIMFSYPTGRGCTTKYDAESSKLKRNPFMEQRERQAHMIEKQNEKILARIKEVSAKSIYSREGFLRQDKERGNLVHRMSKFQNTLAVSSSANRAANVRMQSEKAITQRVSQKVIETVPAVAPEPIDEEPVPDAPLPAQVETTAT